MNERQTDYELLRNFVLHGEQPAFADVVRRHLDLVYATALRKTEEPGAAEEVAQNVFATLARKAWQFARDDSLPAWLHKATLLEAREWLRGELRRRRREQTAAELGTTMKIPEDQAAFRSLVPLLDEALLSLREKDRAALLLRFYEYQSLRDVGASLNVSEDTAQKRVSAALEKLAAYFQKRGHRTATVALTAAALEQTASSASAATASLVIQGALASAPAASSGLAVLLARLGGLSKVQVATACLLAAALPLGWQFQAHRTATREAESSRQQLAAARSELLAIGADIRRLDASASKLENDTVAAQVTVGRNTEAARQYEAWKRKIRGQLLSSDQQWPEDSPFIRIPKTILPQLTIGEMIQPPSTIARTARELLGLTPGERQALEDALQKHSETMGELMSARIVETNQAKRTTIPSNAVAGNVWIIPPLAGDAGETAGALQKIITGTLGPDRVPLVQASMGERSMGGLNQLLNLNALTERQEIGVWITEQDGRPFVNCGWSSESHGGYMCNTSATMDLAWLLPDAPNAERFLARQVLDPIASLPETIRGRVTAWIENEAATRVRKEVAR